jgi:hypothetical protein
LKIVKDFISQIASWASFSSQPIFYFLLLFLSSSMSAHSPAKHQPTLSSRPNSLRHAQHPRQRPLLSGGCPLLTACHRLPTAEMTPCPRLRRLYFTPHSCLPPILSQRLDSFLCMVATESKRIEEEGLSPTKTHWEIFHKSAMNS